LRSIPVTLQALDPDEQEEAMNRAELEAAKKDGTVLALRYGGHETERDELGRKRCIPVTIDSIETRKAGYGGSNKTVCQVRPVPERATDLSHLRLEDQPPTPPVNVDGLLGRRVWEKDIPEEEQGIVPQTVEGRSVLTTWEKYVAIRQAWIEERDDRNRRRDETRAAYARTQDNLERALAGSGAEFSRNAHRGGVSFSNEDTAKLAAFVAELRGAAVEA
jgi:hypothetical protein